LSKVFTYTPMGLNPNLFGGPRSQTWAIP